MFRKVDPISALKAGILGTAIMTIMMYSLPLIGLPPMDVMAALGSVFPFRISPYILGALTHFANGIVIALLFAAFFYSWLPGPNWLKGMLFSFLPWLFAITLLGPSLELASRIFGASQQAAANPCATANPCAVKTPVNPCATNNPNPCAPKAVANPCVSKSLVNPCAASPKNLCAPQAANPCAIKANPCAPKANPCDPGTASEGGIPPQVLSLMAHLIYGGVLGAFYRPRA